MLVIIHAPLPLATAAPRIVAPSLSVTVLPAAAVPLTVGVVSLVTLSVAEVPLSEPAARSGVDGAAGAAVSIVRLSAAEATLSLPAASVAVAVRLCAPLPSAVLVIIHAPLPWQPPRPRIVAPSLSVTVLPAAAVPLTVGVVSLVTLSVAEVPLSEPAARSGSTGLPAPPCRWSG